jgi:hypothetical protein
LRGPSEHLLSHTTLQPRTEAFSGACGELPWSAHYCSPWSWSAHHCFWWDSYLSSKTTGRSPVRIRFPTETIYWDPAAAHKGHREWGTVWWCS